MNAAILRFPSASERDKALQGKPSTFATFDADRTAELLNAAKDSVSTADLLLTFIHSNRSVARQAGIESIVIEIFAIMQGESFSGVIDAIGEAGEKGEALSLSYGGLSTLRRIETLIAEALMNMRKFTDGDFTVMELSADRAKSEADSQRAFIEMEERRLALMRRELDMKEANAKRQQETVASLKSSIALGSPSESAGIAQAEQPRSADLSILIPFAILGAIVATAAVVAAVVREK